MRSNRSSVEAELKRRLERMNAAAGISVANEAKRRAPVDSGRLRSSITSESDATGAVVGTNVSYAPYVHFGTRNNPNPNPFLTDGLLASRDALGRIYGG